MDKKLVTRKQSVAVAVAMAFVAVSNVAQADSAFEWAYWDASPSAGANSAPSGVYPEQVASLDTVKTYNGYDNITAEQMRIGFNGGELLEASTTPVTGTWVGYIPIKTRLNTGEEGSEDITTDTVAKIGLTPKVGSDTLTITSSLEVLKMDFDNSNPDDAGENRRSLTVWPEEGEIVAIYNSSSPDARRTVKAYGERLNDESDERKGQYMSKIDIEKYTTVGTLFGSFALNGSGYIGMKMSAENIATQSALGASYNFFGHSDNGSNTFFIVNFKDASWHADFGESKFNYGWSADGTISDGALTSKKVYGDVNKKGLAESVVSGKLSGDLIGVMNAGAKSSAGIIGSSELNVLIADGGSETIRRNDAFEASIKEQVNVKTKAKYK